MPKTWSESRSSSNKEGNRELAICIDRRGGNSVHGVSAPRTDSLRRHLPGSKSSKDFLIETAKDDSDPEMRRMALRVLADPGFAGHHFFIVARGLSEDPRNPGTLLREDFEGDLGAYVEDIVRQKLDMAAEQLRRRVPEVRALIERRHDFPADLPPPPDGPPATLMPVPDRSESGAPLPPPPPPGAPPVEPAEPKSGAASPSPAPEAGQPGTVQESKTGNSGQP